LNFEAGLVVGPGLGDAEGTAAGAVCACAVPLSPVIPTRIVAATKSGTAV
jgi:hypothetical protein